MEEAFRNGRKASSKTAWKIFVRYQECVFNGRWIGAVIFIAFAESTSFIALPINLLFK